MCVKIRPCQSHEYKRQKFCTMIKIFKKNYIYNNKDIFQESKVYPTMAMLALKLIDMLQNSHRSTEY